ncbi:MAG TPA: hypothetical protein VF230_08810 [Acidimicrobiales bacterium]
MPIGPSEFVQRLVERVPEVRPILNEHLLDNDELLLHVFVARVRDLAIDAFDSDRRGLAHRIVETFELGLHDGNEAVENAVAVSFVEDTPWWDPDRAEFIETWPTGLRNEAERQSQEASARQSRTEHEQRPKGAE